MFAYPCFLAAAHLPVKRLFCFRNSDAHCNHLEKKVPNKLFLYKIYTKLFFPACVSGNAFISVFLMFKQIF